MKRRKKTPREKMQHRIDTGSVEELEALVERLRRRGASLDILQKAQRQLEKKREERDGEE